ncbi:hypothetical protein THARTR1_00549 [Trichoderma harzianum]|uniref:Short-chain dehydrogenase n=1 Tax=Trichoderma harzianum TaxID=5544 RepID=A0A2K0URW7_TRIHA|nr:hypothetical protein THARTR1_00549 [Trichoderma harzianum]
MAPPFFAIISGVGSGTGASVARRFAQSYAVVLLSRKPSSYESIVADIKAAGGTAIGITADAADPAAVDAAFVQIEKELPGSKLAAANLDSSANGLFYFAQKTLPLLLAAVDSSPHPPSLLVTGATASLRGSAFFSTFAAGKFAQRAITQSLAREFGPKGIHVALAVIDGGIDTPWGKDRIVNNGVEDGKISPDAIADSYWHLHTQHRSSFTQELDIRPFVEKF